MNFTGLYHLRNHNFFSFLSSFSLFFLLLLTFTVILCFTLLFSIFKYNMHKTKKPLCDHVLQKWTTSHDCWPSPLEIICRTVLVSSMAIMVIQIVERKSCYRNVTRSTLILNNCQVFIHMGTITTHYYY